MKINDAERRERREEMRMMEINDAERRERREEMRGRYESVLAHSGILVPLHERRLWSEP